MCISPNGHRHQHKIIKKHHQKPARFASSQPEDQAKLKRIVQKMDDLAKMRAISRSGNFNDSTVKAIKKGNDSNEISKHFDAVFVITLADRKQYVEAVMRNHYGIGADKLVIVDAVDAELIYNEPMLKKLYDRKILANGTTWTNPRNGSNPHQKFHTFNEIAAELSHLHVYYQIYSNRSIEKALIFQDDVAKQSNLSHFKQQFDRVMTKMKNIDPDWEWINFGRCWDDCKH